MSKCTLLISHNKLNGYRTLTLTLTLTIGLIAAQFSFIGSSLKDSTVANNTVANNNVANKTVAENTGKYNTSMDYILIQNSVTEGSLESETGLND